MTALGWKMLMECLAAGRGISLPAGAAGASNMITNTVGGPITIPNIRPLNLLKNTLKDYRYYSILKSFLYVC